MGIVPSGDEDPREILGRISDATLARVVGCLARLARHPAVMAVAQFFVVEWSVRTGRVDEWSWSWDGPSEGRMTYRPARPIGELFKLACLPGPVPLSA